MTLREDLIEAMARTLVISRRSGEFAAFNPDAWKDYKGEVRALLVSLSQILKAKNIKMIGREPTENMIEAGRWLPQGLKTQYERARAVWIEHFDAAPDLLAEEGE